MDIILSINIIINMNLEIIFETSLFSIFNESKRNIVFSISTFISSFFEFLIQLNNQIFFKTNKISFRYIINNIYNGFSISISRNLFVLITTTYISFKFIFFDVVPIISDFINQLYSFFLIIIDI